MPELLTKKGIALNKRARRKDLRTWQPIERATWRERTRGDILPAQDDRGQLGARAGDQRCGAIGLIRGDCDHDAWRGSTYCYYHEKLRLGLMEPSADIYPVWPLSQAPNGYIIIKSRASTAA